MDQTQVRLGERIKERRKALKWKQIDLARATGIDPSLISFYESGKRRLNETNLWKISGALGWSPDKFYSSTANVVEVSSSETRQVPLLDYVQAGNWTEVHANRIDSDQFEMMPVSIEYPPSTFVMEIRGDSMMPKFEPGDRVIIAPTLTPKPGDFVVARDENGEATFKKFRDHGIDAEGRPVFELVALNPDYAPMRSDRQTIAIVGVMVEHRHFRKR